MQPLGDKTELSTTLNVEGIPSLKTRDLATILEQAQRDLKSKENNLERVFVPSLKDKKNNWIKATIGCTLLLAGTIALSVYLINNSRPGSLNGFGAVNVIVLGAIPSGIGCIYTVCGFARLFKYTDIDSQKGRDQCAKILEYRTLKEIINEIYKQKELVFVRYPSSGDMDEDDELSQNEFLLALIQREQDETRKKQYQKIYNFFIARDKARAAFQGLDKLNSLGDQAQVFEEQQNNEFNTFFDNAFNEIVTPKAVS